MRSELAVLNETEQRKEFITLVALGTPENAAGHEVGWTPRNTQRYCSEPDFAELIAYAKERAVDGIETVLFEMARGGNMQAVAMILLNMRPQKFRDVKRIEVASSGTVVHEHVHSLKQSLSELLFEQGPAAFQIGGALDAIEAQSAEVPVEGT